MHSTMWIPEPGTVNHMGQPVAADDDFFVAPPSEIGPVLTAQTTLRQSAEPTSLAPHRMRSTFLTGAAIFVLCWLLSLADWRPDQIRTFWSVSGWTVCAAMLIAWFLRRPDYVCSYVGTLGIASFRCWGRRSNIMSSELLLFETVATLRASTRNIYVNGAYLNSEFSFRWFDSSRVLLYKLSGIHRDHGAGKPVDHPYEFALSAQYAWTEYLKPAVLSSIESGASWRFGVGRGGWVEIAGDCIELRGRRIRYQDLDLSVERGFIVFRRKGDSRAWYRLDRVPRVAYAATDNALLMLSVVADKGGLSKSVAETASQARYHLLHLSP